MRHILTLTLLLALLVGPPLALAAPTRAQGEEDSARALLEAMSPEERVGQLFVVSFVGSDGGAGSDIATLIEKERVGGLVLLAANQNFTNDADAPLEVRALSEQLQSTALRSGARLPLFVAIDHEGDGWPYSRLTGGTTPLPSPMAIGATWEPMLAEEMGAITGQELAAVGVNLLLGPSVDVLAEPRESNRGDLGTRTFGGDPEWVGRMGRAYIRGVHEGSAGRMATVAKHFPGHGGSDRLPDNEVATVDKSLFELRRIELPPFFAVTRAESEGDLAVTDAMMSSHIRYRGLQGNIRQFTAPISFDLEGLRAILAEEEFAEWRAEGLIVSDSLGVPAVKRYFDPTGESFPHRQIARDALMSGNDLLILAQFAREDLYEPQLANMRDVMGYFREQYGSDPAFARRVDEAALKVIRLKLRLYPEFAEGPTALPPLPEPRFGEHVAFTQEVAEQALTLVYPQGEAPIEERMPRAPLRGEPIVIFTDARRVRDCFDCPYYHSLPRDGLEQAILRLYGPEGTGQINEAQIISLSFWDLELYLGVPEAANLYDTPEEAQARAEDVRQLVERADWIVLAMQEINLSPPLGGQAPRYPESDAARLLLDAAVGSLVNKRVVAFFFNVPYQLDTTEISKLTAAYALYAKQEPFVDVAARALFREVTPQGQPPVTIESINYDLPTQLEPAPDQPLPLAREGEGMLLVPGEVTVRSGIVLDRNGHAVPDGTMVEFEGSWRDEPERSPVRASTTTRDGVAEATLSVTRPGDFEVVAIAQQARSQTPLRIEALAPTPTPDPNPEPTAEPTTTTEPVAVAPTGEAPPAAEPPARPEPPPPDPARPLDLMAALGAAAAVALATLRGRPAPVEGVQGTLLALVGALTGYLVWGSLGGLGGTAGALLAALGSAVASCAFLARMKEDG